MDTANQKKLIIALCLLDLGIEAYVNQLVQVDFKSGYQELTDSILGTTSRLLDQYQKASVLDKPKILNQLRETILPKIKAHFSSYKELLNVKSSEISLAFPEIFGLMYGEGFQNAKNFEQNLLFGKPVSDWFNTSANNISGGVVNILSNDGTLGDVAELLSKLPPTIEMVTDGLIRQTANNSELALVLANQKKFTKLQFVAVMDSRTSKICRSLNGKIFPVELENIPTPPLHPRCRSKLVPLVDREITLPSFNNFLGMLHQQGKIDLIKSILGSGAYDLYAKDKFTSLTYFTNLKFKSTEEIVSLIKRGIE